MQLKIRRLTKSTVRKQPHEPDPGSLPQPPAICFGGGHSTQFPHDDFVPGSGWRFLRFNDADWSVIGY